VPYVKHPDVNRHAFFVGLVQIRGPTRSGAVGARIRLLIWLYLWYEPIFTAELDLDRSRPCPDWALVGPWLAPCWRFLRAVPGLRYGDAPASETWLERLVTIM
jgi:hypothetical protein